MNFTYRYAELSDDHAYRYMLERRWMWRDEYTPYVLWVLLNPSIADAKIDDPTVRVMAGFSSRWGYLRMRVANLYAWRATRPRMLRYAQDPIGPENDGWLALLSTDSRCHQIVVAWGQNPIKNQRHYEVLTLLATAGKRLCTLGRNASGHPSHPLMQAYHTPLQEYSHAPYAAPLDRCPRAG